LAAALSPYTLSSGAMPEEPRTAPSLPLAALMPWHVARARVGPAWRAHATKKKKC
jgi:hypothetical protein